MKANRILYLGYYLKELDREKFQLFLEHTSRITGKSKSSIISDILSSVFRYNISIIEYFQFRFYELSEEERDYWAGTGYMYEFQQMMNPVKNRKVLEYKPDFMREYNEFIHHDSATLDELKNDSSKGNRLLNTKSGKLVLKRSDGGSGKGIEVVNSKDYTYKTLLERMKKTNNDMVEEFVVQHQELMRLSPSGLNTIRIISQLTDDGDVHIIGCRLRMTVNSHVDNMAAGNIAASVDSQTGIVISNAVYSDITKGEVEKHPVTGVTIKGFALPYWQETIDLVKRAAKKNSLNKSIGWDVAITDRGPELIEGNHDWCKLLWQLPERKGLKHLLEPYQNHK